MSNSAETESQQQRATLMELLREEDDSRLARAAAGVHPADLAELLDSLDENDGKLRLFGVLTAEHGSEVMRHVGDATRGLLQDNLSDARLATIVEHLDTDDATDLLGELPEDRQQELLDQTSPETRKDVEELLAYPEDSAGGIMKTEVAVVGATATVRDITEYLRHRGDEFHDIHQVFVTGERNRLLGSIPLRRLLLARDSTPAERIMETDLVSVRTDLDQEEVAHLFEKYDVVSVPVVDSLGRVCGRITIDDIVDVIEEEATEDMLRLAGVAGESVEVADPIHGVRSRLPWLALDLIATAASAAVVAMFEGTIQTIAIAAALMTIVARQGGNAGLQTLTLIVRGLAVGQIETSQALRIVGRECVVALANGTALGLTAGGVVYVWRGDLALSVVLGSAMVLNFLIAAILGTLVPLGLKAVNVDPAVSSSVFVTAGTDMLGFFIFLGLLSLVVQ